jgi:hypothetical protein
MSTNRDKKDVSQLENDALVPGLAPVNYQHPRPSIASRLLKVVGISVMGLLLFTVFACRRFNTARDVSEVGFFLSLTNPTQFTCYSYQQA